MEFLLKLSELQVVFDSKIYSLKDEICNLKNVESDKTTTEGPCLMRLFVLGKIHISQMFGLCNLPNENFELFFISLVRFFGQK